MWGLNGPTATDGGGLWIVLWGVFFVALGAIADQTAITALFALAGVGTILAGIRAIRRGEVMWNRSPGGERGG